MASGKKVAIITGGASGMGLAICEALAANGDWVVNMLDMNAERGNEASTKFGATFHQTDVTNYDSLSKAFSSIYKSQHRIDFVHANAGIIEKGDFYGRHDTGDKPPPAFPSLTVDIDLFSVIQTCHLALHYMRQTGKDVSRSIVVTASCGGLYAVPNAPTYAAAKFGAVGWTRSIAGRLWYDEGIRVNVSRPHTPPSYYADASHRPSAPAQSARTSSRMSSGRGSRRTISRLLRKSSKSS